MCACSYVSNLASNTSRDKLTELFACCGAICNITPVSTLFHQTLFLSVLTPFFIPAAHLNPWY
jgi:hypothetical protein